MMRADSPMYLSTIAEETTFEQMCREGFERVEQAGRRWVGQWMLLGAKDRIRNTYTENKKNKNPIRMTTH